MDEELFDKYLTGALSPDEEARLARLLKEDPRAGEALVRHVRETTLMVQVASQLSAAAPKAARRLMRFRPLRSTGAPWIAAAAAAVLVGVSLLVAFPPGTGKPAPPPSKSGEVVRRAEERIEEIRQKEQKLAAPAPDPAAERKREDERAQLRAERERIEREMRQAIDRERKPQETVRKPEPPAPPPDVPRPSPETRAAVATVREVEGDVTRVTPAGRTEAGAGQALLAGDGLETGAGGRAVVEYPDGTRLKIGPETRAKEFTEAPGKRVQVERGSLSGEVSRQPPGKPMVFVSLGGEATVLGTTLRILVDASSMRLDVIEGRVRLKRLSDGKAVEVASGHFAVAAAGLELTVRPLPIDEIQLLAHKAKVFGKDWGPVADDQASTGKALEAPAVRQFDQSLSLLKRNQLGFAEFTFVADADKTYHVWIRGKSTAAKDRELHDGVAIEIPGGKPSDQFLIPDVPGGSERVYLSGFGARAGYTWVCRAGDYFEQTPPVTVRFVRPGPQKLRVYGFETPVRIDAIWLSATQVTRPADGDTGPK